MGSMAPRSHRRLPPHTPRLAPESFGGRPHRICRGSINATLSLPNVATQMPIPADGVTDTATPNGLLPTGIVAIGAPSIWRSTVTVLLPLLATQTLAPAKTMPLGPSPTGEEPCSAPSLARRRVTLRPKKLVIQTLRSSSATPNGPSATG